MLIIGYGNSLRGDDNVGCHVAQMLDRHYDGDPDVRVIGSHQLTPEMAEDIAASEFVLFLDAAAGEPAGKIKAATVNATARASELCPSPRPRVTAGRRDGVVRQRAPGALTHYRGRDV